jgi:hypothetical protein
MNAVTARERTEPSGPPVDPGTAHRRVLMVSPHFPPDTSAGTHRVRLIAPYLSAFGWEPVVLTVDPARYEQSVEPELSQLVPEDLRVIRCAAWSPRWTRRLGVGDLGLRAFVPALRAASRLLRTERVDALFVTTYPVYTAGLGPILKRRFGVPFVIDVQDPWVGAWGHRVGGAPDGGVDFKSRVSRRLAQALEAPVFEAADAITAVSMRTIEDIWTRVPRARSARSLEIPIGADRRDFDTILRSPRRQPFFDPGDGLVHLCSVGTLLPLGVGVASALFEALACLRAEAPADASRLRLHFFGTSNDRAGDSRFRALPLARAAGVADLVSEHPARIDYLDAVRLQLDASALLLLGSEEPHYTASRLYPALLARRPLLAVYHEKSTVSRILRQHTRPPTVRLVEFDSASVTPKREELVAALSALAGAPAYSPADVSPAAITDYSALTIAGRLARLLSDVAA